MINSHVLIPCVLFFVVNVFLNGNISYLVKLSLNIFTTTFEADTIDAITKAIKASCVGITHFSSIVSN
jgi:hypothetical protein